MSTAITVTYKAPNTLQGGRYRAVARTSENGTTDLTVPESKGPDAAAKLLAEKLKWDGDYVRGETNGAFVYVRTNNANSFNVATD